MTPNTDAPNADAPDADDNDSSDAPDAADDDSDYFKLIQFSLRSRYNNSKIAPKIKNNKNNITTNTDAPNGDAPDAAYKYDAYHYSLRNRKTKKKNMTTNTDAHDDDAPDAADYYDASPDSLILDLSLKNKIDPKSMLKLKHLNDSNWCLLWHQRIFPWLKKHWPPRTQHCGFPKADNKAEVGATEGWDMAAGGSR